MRHTSVLFFILTSIYDVVIGCGDQDVSESSISSTSTSSTATDITNQAFTNLGPSCLAYVGTYKATAIDLGQ